MKVFSRSIFLLVRGVNMLGGAFTEATKQVETLEEKERQLANTAYKTMFGGAALFAFGALMAKGLMGFLETTSKGVLIMDSLGLAWDRLSSRLGTGIAQAFEPHAKALIDFMDWIGSNQQAMGWLGTLAVYLTELTLAVGGFLLVKGGIDRIGGMLAQAFGPLVTALGMKFAPNFMWSVAEAGGVKALIWNSLLTALAPLGITSVGSALAWILPITLTILVIKTLWDWYSTDDEGRLNMAIEAGKQAGSPFEKPYGGTEPGYGLLPQDVIVNVYGDFNGTPQENGESIANAVADMSNTGQYTYK
jgi:hypothetical protein